MLFIHSLWPGQPSEIGWVKYEGSGELYCLLVCIVPFRSANVTNIFCLLQFLSTSTGSSLVGSVSFLFRVRVDVVRPFQVGVVHPLTGLAS